MSFLTRYEIEIYFHGAGNQETEEAIRQIREHLVPDLTEGIDQRKDSIYHGEDGMDHNSIFVDPSSVGEAVRRINEAGFATDEDEDKE